MSSRDSSRVEVDRPAKIDMFLWLAWSIKELSMDGQTQHGCVITNRKNRVLGMGYNSFPRDMDNESLPNMRPEKYPWMIHAEENAVTNCTHKPKKGIAYVTGYCCGRCLRHLWQNGVDTVYEMDRASSMVGDTDFKIKKELMKQVPLKVHIIRPDFTFAKGLIGSAAMDGLIHGEFDKSVKCFGDV